MGKMKEIMIPITKNCSVPTGTKAKMRYDVTNAGWQDWRPEVGR